MVVQRPAPDAMASMYGTILLRNFAPMVEGDLGYWWRMRMIELGFTSTNQIEWRLDRIPFTPTSPGIMFISPINENGSTAPTHYTRLEAMRYHNQKIANSTFPLSTIRSCSESGCRANQG